MKTRWIIILWCVTAFHTSVFSQCLESNNSIILREESTSGKFRGVVDDHSQGVVDINSIIRIQLCPQKIEEEMFRMAGATSNNARLEKLRDLNHLLEYELTIAQKLNDYYKSNQDISIADRKDWENVAKEFRDEFARTQKELFKRLRDTSDPINKEMTKFTQDGGELEVFMLMLVDEEAKKVRQELNEELGLLGGDNSTLIYFRLGAFIKNRQGGRAIHVENFDEIETEAFSEIKRFETAASISEEEFSELRKYANLTNNINTENEKAIKWIQVSLTQQMDNLITSKKAFDSFEKAWKKAQESMPQNVLLTQAIQEINNQLSAFNFLDESIQKVIAQISSSAINMLEPSRTLDASEVASDLTGLSNKLDSLNFQSLNGEIPEDQIESLKTQKNILLEAVKTDINSIKGFIKSLPMTLGLKKISLKNEEFSEKVKRFTAGNIPREGFIELKYIGERHPGDEILIKAVIERGKDKKANGYEEREIYRRYLSIQKITPYVKMSASLILASPYNRDKHNGRIELENNHQFAASYGVFLKWGSRKSRFYNNFIDFGVGLNFASPDFNLDGTPEFGAGVVVTALKDWVSAGWGWNFGIDAPYSFIGFNIPFTIGGFGSTSTNAGRDLN